MRKPLSVALVALAMTGCLAEQGPMAVGTSDAHVAIPPIAEGALQFGYVATGPDNFLWVNGTDRSDAFAVIAIGEEGIRWIRLTPLDGHVVSPLAPSGVSLTGAASGGGSVELTVLRSSWGQPFTIIVMAAHAEGSGTVDVALRGADVAVVDPPTTGGARYYRTDDWSGERLSARIPSGGLVGADMAYARKLDWTTQNGTVAIYGVHGIPDAPRSDAWTLRGSEKAWRVDRLSASVTYASHNGDDRTLSVDSFLLLSEERSFSLDVEHRAMLGAATDAVLVADIAPVRWSGTSLH